MSFLVFCCVFGIWYAYFGYPLLLLVLSKTGHASAAIRDSASAAQEYPELSVVITVRNEAKWIATKLENTLALTYPGAREGQLQILVASDASDDETDAIVEQYVARGVELIRLSERGGKERAQLQAVERATGSIIVFTDAKILLEENALERFARYFRDPSVGAVSSCDVVGSFEERNHAELTAGSGEGMYVRYEMGLRALESDTGGLVGLSGSCFAVRRSVALHIRENLPSDFVLLMEAAKRGLRGVHAPDVNAYYSSVKTESEEFQRKIRTVLRGMSAFFAYREMWDVRRGGLFSWKLLSHKLFRWLVPVFFCISLILSVVGSRWSGFLALVSACSILLLLAAEIAVLAPKHRDKLPVKVALYLVVTNAAIAIAWWRYMTGNRVVQWDPSNKS